MPPEMENKEPSLLDSTKQTQHIKLKIIVLPNRLSHTRGMIRLIWNRAIHLGTTLSVSYSTKRTVYNYYAYYLEEIKYSRYQRYLIFSILNPRVI